MKIKYKLIYFFKLDFTRGRMETMVSNVNNKRITL